MRSLKIIIFISLLLSIANAQDTNTSSDENYIDTWHKLTTEQFKNVSEYIDDKLFDIADFVDTEDNVTTDKVITKEDKKEKIIRKKRHADKFFLSDKYISETDDPFLRITPEGKINSKSSNSDKAKLKIRVHIPLSKSKKRFKLFIGNLSNDNVNDVLSDDKTKSTPEIGVNYFSPDYYGIRSKYSLGVHGIYPFARARYATDFIFDNWDTEYVQTFEYFSDDKFEEKTQAYFDTVFANLSLFRVYAERGTKEKSPGMSYNAGVVMFWQPSDKDGLTITQAIAGSTKYRYTKTGDVNTALREYSGINDYITTITYRQSFYRKWLFYELEPGVNFSIVDDYKPNYSLRLKIDIFYGKL